MILGVLGFDKGDQRTSEELANADGAPQISLHPRYDWMEIRTDLCGYKFTDVQNFLVVHCPYIAVRKSQESDGFTICGDEFDFKCLIAFVSMRYRPNISFNQAVLLDSVQ